MKIKDRAFTLIEMVVIIVILALLSSLATVSYRNVMRAQVQRDMAIDLEMLKAALEVYRSKHGTFPLPPAPGGMTWTMGGIGNLDEINQNLGTNLVFKSGGTFVCEFDVSPSPYPAQCKVYPYGDDTDFWLNIHTQGNGWTVPHCWGAVPCPGASCTTDHGADCF